MTQDKAVEVLKTGANVFLTGEPGAGKTYTIDLFKAWMEEKGVAYAITASTGIAASHLDGSTIHSWSGLGIRRGLRKEQLDQIAYNTWMVERMKPISTLVIDEISMLDAVLLDDVSNILKAVHGNTKPFGGIQVVLVGDFFQLPPVARDGEKKEFAFNAPSWIEAQFEICYLTEQHRQSDGEFLDILKAMRAGTVTDEHKARLRACSMTKKPDTKLFTHNADVDRLNAKELAKLPGEVSKYKMRESGDPKYIETLKKQCLSPEVLEIKKDAVVMFTRNNFKAGYVNGTIGKVTEIKKNGDIVVTTLDGARVTPELSKWSYRTRKRGEVASIEQVPLRLAWAITVHKSQGMSLDAAEVDLGNTFEFGQGYVAISRVRSLEGLHLTAINDLAFAMHPEVVAKDREFREVGV